MEFLNKAQLVKVAGANAGGNYESFNNPKIIPVILAMAARAVGL